MAKKFGIAVTGCGLLEIAGLFERLRGLTAVTQFEMTLGCPLPILLLGKDRCGRRKVAGLDVELGRVGEAILIVSYLCRAHILLRLDEQIGGAVHQRDREQHLSGLDELSLLRQGVRTLLSLLGDRFVDHRESRIHLVGRLFVVQFAVALGNAGKHEHQYTDRRQQEPQAPGQSTLDGVGMDDVEGIGHLGLDQARNYGEHDVAQAK